MAITRTSLLNELKDTRLGATAFTDAVLKTFIDTAIMGLFPTYYKMNVDTTIATSGQIQTMPTGCSNVVEVVLATARPRRLRGWMEGNGEAYISAYAVGDGDITGTTLVWSWVSGWDAPASDGATIDIPVEAREFVILKAHLFALQSLLTGRLETDKYFATQVRQAISEDEILATIDSIQRELEMKSRLALPLPKVEK